jgi:acylphosphatase
MNLHEIGRLHAIMNGRVQGVGFRYYVVEVAEVLGLSGWVRNTFDGNVEVVAEGALPDLEKLLSKIRSGPPSAFVTEVDQEWLPATGEYSGFSVGRTV